MALQIGDKMGFTWQLPPKFFFAVTQEERRHDTINELLLDNDTCIIGKDEIMLELEWFYCDLFAKDH